jgi:hypothetical protein
MRRSYKALVFGEEDSHSGIDFADGERDQHACRSGVQFVNVTTGLYLSREL